MNRLSSNKQLLEKIYVVEKKEINGKVMDVDLVGRQGIKRRAVASKKEAHFDEYLKNQKVDKLDVKNEMSRTL